MWEERRDGSWVMENGKWDAIKVAIGERRKRKERMDHRS
jgi:hypothetical protein